MINFFKSYYIVLFRKYAVFNGRANRTEFWGFTIFNLLIFFVLFAIDVVPLILIYLITTIIPSIAVSVRRLHDINKSGLFYLINFIPIVGNAVFFIFMLLKSTGSNRYGYRPY